MSVGVANGPGGEVWGSGSEGCKRRCRLPSLAVAHGPRWRFILWDYDVGLLQPHTVRCGVAYTRDDHERHYRMK
jgi:hypothetical protein